MIADRFADGMVTGGRRGGGCRRSVRRCGRCDRIDVVLQLDRHAARRVDAESVGTIFTDLHDRDIDDDFRPRLVEIFD
jgi:hypothetical protein